MGQPDRLEEEEEEDGGETAHGPVTYHTEHTHTHTRTQHLALDEEQLSCRQQRCRINYGF